MQLNTEQQEAVDHDGHSLVVACPGSGKTRVITVKIGALLNRHPGANICAVTFTRDAAAELKRRLIVEIGEQAFRRHCRVGTFHSLAIKQLRAAGMLGKVASPSEQRAYLRRALAFAAQPIPFDMAVQCIERAKTTFGDCPEKQTPLYETYRELLARNQVEDLYDVIRRAVERMRDGKLKPIQAQFMLVDEFQDTDHIQMAWVMEHVRGGTNVTVVGDDDQSIYGWRGALGYPGMEDFMAQTDARRITLAVNYRSREEILSAADSLISRSNARVPKQLFAARGKGGRIVSSRWSGRKDEAAAVASEVFQSSVAITPIVSDAVHRTVPAGSWAVLSRNRYLLDRVEQEMLSSRIKYRRSAGESIWNRPPFVFLLGLLKAIQTGDNDGVDQVLNHALSIRVGASASHTALTELHKQFGTGLYRLMHGDGLDLTKLTPESAEVVKEFSERAVGWRNLARAGKYGMVVRGVTSWLATFEEHDDARQFLIKVGEDVSKLKGTLAARATALSRPFESAAETELDGVQLCTMHSSKGLEFDNVWIVGCDCDTIPSPKSLDFEEERRLMYVAMTRAKDTLFLSSIVAIEPSPFVLDAGCDPRLPASAWIRDGA